FDVTSRNFSLKSNTIFNNTHSLVKGLQMVTNDMDSLSELLGLSIVVDEDAHSWAKQFVQHLSDQPAQAKQVYLNTLCVCAVYDYLFQMGYEPELAGSDSWSPVMHTVMDVADVSIPGVGQIECRAVLPGDKFMTVPPEVWEDRLGYIAVQIDPLPPNLAVQELTIDQLRSLQTAKLLGFIEKVATEKVPLTELQPIATVRRILEQRSPLVPVLLSHLHQPVIQLAQWLQEIYNDGWLAVDNLLGTHTPQAALNFRGTLTEAVNAEIDVNQETPDLIRQGKRFSFDSGTAENQIILLVGFVPSTQKEIDIVVEIYPGYEQLYLPSDLNLTLINQSGEIILQMKAADNNPHMRLRFSGESGEYFGIKLDASEKSFMETFLI
ncbi:MAG TPA: DUF1822 family protein, partial [Cyanophyceae cyanobacterium]